MRTWEHMINTYFKNAKYLLREGPWYAFFSQDLVMIICTYFPPIPIPFGSKFKVKDPDFNNSEFTVKEYYGNLRDIFHCYICMVVTEWSESKIKDVKEFDANYEEVKQILGKTHPELFDNEED